MIKYGSYSKKYASILRNHFLLHIPMTKEEEIMLIQTGCIESKDGDLALTEYGNSLMDEGA